MRTLVIGGARSGKSRFAHQMAAQSAHDVCFIATAEAHDGEMGARIERHRAERPAHWMLIEEPIALAQVIQSNATPHRCVLVDCLTLWLSNLLHLDDEARFEQETNTLLGVVEEIEGALILVSNETGLGVVPMGALSRRFVDEAGSLHQALAESCDRVVMTVAGLPVWLKGE